MTVPAMREIDPEVLVPVDSKHESHRDMFKTLDLLKLDTTKGRIYFVVEGCSKFEPLANIQEYRLYFYEEHTCPTNFLRVERVYFEGDCDPHGLFDFVRSVWMPLDYADNKPEKDEILRRLFPELEDRR